MAAQAGSDIQDRDHRSTAPYTAQHPVPTVQRFRRRQNDQGSGSEAADSSGASEHENGGVRDRVKGPVKKMLGKENREASGDPYPTTNKNEADESSSQKGSETSRGAPGGSNTPDSEGETAFNDAASKDADGEQNFHQQIEGMDPRQKRKAFKKMERNTGGKEVTDPVTHLRIVQKDATDKDLAAASKNEPAAGTEPHTFTGVAGASKPDEQLSHEEEALQETHSGMQQLFPPPHFRETQAELARLYSDALFWAVIIISSLAAITMVCSMLLTERKASSTGSLILKILPVFGAIGVSSFVTALFIPTWLKNRTEAIWEEKVWTSANNQERKRSLKAPESTQWLNSLLASIWPLINPDLFTSLVDTLEDVMQASLPKLVRMISIEDLGQGSEAFRILGVRWLPTGAAARSVASDGKLKPQSKQQNDRVAPGEGSVENDDDAEDRSEDEQQIAEGMEAEQGDFVNLELAFAYKARTSGKSLKKKSQNAHLLLKFYLPGGVAVPVWVEVRGFIGTMRMRLQLTPDPPFVALATITFLGQPKADMSCIPLSKHNLDVMDVPLISSFVQSSINAALAEYVAPKSLTLDLKSMLVGDDFKKDTASRGILAVRIKRAYDFKAGDTDVMGIKKGSSDPYIAVGWAKYGKIISSTRKIMDEMQPSFEEWMYLLVGPEELNAEEILRIQLWDSDRTTADDDLGRVELDLKDIVNGSEPVSKLQDRKDGLTGLENQEKWPGTIEWAVGYFPKTRVTSDEVKISPHTQANDVEELKQQVMDNAEQKLREAKKGRDEENELSQQKEQDMIEQETQILISAPPRNDRPSGILSVQIHQITGLELEQGNKNTDNKKNDDGENEESDDLPSSYCNIIINHAKVFKTRTKPKNAKPFFNAGNERFIRDWRTAEVILSIRDSRVHESNPLLGIVHLPLAEIFKERSQVISTWPLVGGLGYGRARVSLVFRSVELQLPKQLLGWDYGTVEIIGAVTSKDLKKDLQRLNIKFRSSATTGKMRPVKDSSGQENTSANTMTWKPKHQNPSLYLAICNRYSSCLTICFRKTSLGNNSTAAFAIVWLKDLIDNEESTLSLDVWDTKSVSLKRASSCVDIDHGDAKPLGTIQLQLNFHPGLSGWHAAMKGKSQDLNDVLEVLDTAADHHLTSTSTSSVRSRSTSSSSSSSSSSSDSGNESNRRASSSGPLSQVKDYKQHHKQLHRRHRGLMQWKGVRTLDWMGKKIEHGRGKVEGLTRHGEAGGGGVETEV
ncbi:MAG: hypothetical protein Q9160_008976 [Pyrenula sp. 1 TL-2023]